MFIRRGVAAVAVCSLVITLAACGGGVGGGSIVSSGVQLNTETLPVGTTGLPYDTTLDADFPNPPGVFLLASGQLPSGVKLDVETGRISGYPHQVGSFRFEIEARDGADQSAPRDFTFAASRKSFTMTVDRGPPAFVPQTIPTGQYRASYSYAFDVAGGTPPYQFELTGGALPTGVVVNPTGTLGSFPTQAGTFLFEVTATDTLGLTAVGQFSMDVVVLPLLIKTSALPDAAQHFPYAEQIELSSNGGGSPYQWSQVFPLDGDTDLATIGMEVKLSDGTLQQKSGFPGPSVAGTFNFRLQVTDQASQTATRAFTLKVNPGPVLSSITPNRSIQPGPYVVSGLNFQPGAVLVFAPGTANEVTVNPSFVSATTLQFTTAPAIAGGGAVSVRVVNPDTGAHTKNAAFLFPFANLSFGTKGLLTGSPLSTMGLVAGDLTGDGLAEVVHAGAAGFQPYNYVGYSAPASTTGGLHLLRNDGALAFTPVVLDGGNWFDVEIADVNVDGKPDIVALGANEVRTWINDPLGTFTPTASSFLPNDANFTQPSRMAIGLFNNDALPDILFGVSQYNNLSGRAYTMTGTGSGTFVLAGSELGGLTNTRGVNAVAAVDLNGDGRHEAVALGGWNNSTNSTFRYNFLNLNATFGSWSSSASAAGTSWGTNMTVAAGNFLGNGTPAVITMHQEDPGDGGQKELKLWSGPSLATGQVLTAPTGAGKVVFAADFDYDLSTDFAVSWNTLGTATSASYSSTTTGFVDVYKGSTKAKLQTLDLLAGTPSVSAARSGEMASGDLDGDGKADLLVSTSFWMFDYQPYQYTGHYYSLRLTDDGSPRGIVYYLNSSN